MHRAAEAIWEAVHPRLADYTVEVLPQIDSTSTELMRRARAGQSEPVLLVALQQTAGRGRLGRVWQSGVGDALTFSLSLPLQPRDWSGLSLAVGTSVAESLQAMAGDAVQAQVQLKWPNDLWLAGAKLAGILIETASFGQGGATARQVVIGIGINVLPRAGDGLSTPPAWLQQLVPDATAARALQQIAPALVQAVLEFETAGFAPFAGRFAARDALNGRTVRLSDGSEGMACGVSATGGLLVHTGGAMKEITSAEVSVRPC
jgi:BirA family biotin operon repressor/biotin-[acetyl-CoA-carboxylase] ligase